MKLLYSFHQNTKTEPGKLKSSLLDKQALNVEKKCLFKQHFHKIICITYITHLHMSETLNIYIYIKYEDKKV